MPAAKRATKPAAQNRSRLQAPKSAASKARSKAAMMEKARPKGRAGQISRLRPRSSSRRPRAAWTYPKASRSHLRQS